MPMEVASAEPMPLLTSSGRVVIGLSPKPALTRTTEINWVAPLSSTGGKASQKRSEERAAYLMTILNSF